MFDELGSDKFRVRSVRILLHKIYFRVAVKALFELLMR